MSAANPTSEGDGRLPIRRALVSVYDKTGLPELARALHAAGVEIVSTGSTAGMIEAAGGPVTRVEELTGFPECLDGRVKTLHPKVHAGLLADLRQPSHRAQLDEFGIAPFDLLVSNLYPFQETVASGASVDECVEQIDIGGPAMVRSAAKNHANVAVVTTVSAYPQIINALADGGFTLRERRALAARAFADIAEYDVAVAQWCARVLAPPPEETGPGALCWPDFTGVTLRRSAVLRYGENPHQAAALYTDSAAPAGLAQAQQLHGKEMSYNNYVDADAAWRSVHDFDGPCVAIIKHANPCGIAVGVDVAEAHRKAHACDPVSAFGGVIAVNRPVTVELANQLADIFTEVIVAPGYSDDAVDVLTAKKSLRVLVAPEWQPAGADFRRISGGVLAQTVDWLDAPGDDVANWRLAAGEPADEATLRDLAFAWRAVRSVKSNAILLAADGATIGVGMGQVNRVDALQVLIDAGVRAVAQPGGSIRDEAAIAAADAAGITMYFTGARHFFH
jgi:phosphoribosylaminoimidazolecarboxamide formyltransferase/IMP cyclohydrolase